ncbi:MAG: 4-hydroxy-tetrahydrodipicolinate synthase [Ruminococcaceae bacterium]|nr:4-hydroxy-tetrahydrodipicolinate synthase [Oscillospiraceae bacterium]
MSKTIFTGSGVALVTPFTNEGVNYDALGKLIDFQLENSTDAIIICGTTGENATMPDDEHLEVVRYTIDRVNKRIPVIAGTGSNYTEHAIDMTREVEKMGADGVLCVTPYYNKTTQKGLIASYTAIAESTSLPVIMYNVPSRTGVNMLPETVKVLSEIDNIVGLKEASGNMSQVLKIMSLCPELDIYSGEDALIAPIMMMGGKGVISVLANVAPKETHLMTEKLLKGEFEEAKKMQLDALELVDALFCEVNPIPVKTAMRLMGFDAGQLRLPLVEMDEKNLQKLVAAMTNYGIKLK